MVYAPTAIDLSRLPPPNAVEEVDRQVLLAQFKGRFLAEWANQQLLDPMLPDYDTFDLPSNRARVLAEAWAFTRTLDHSRVNDVYRSLLAPLAKGTSMDQIAAGKNLLRRTIVPATDTAPAIMEGDAALLRRYLLKFDEPSSGSSGRYLFDAWTAWPQSEDKSLGLWDARVNGYAVHGKRGRTDVVVIGPYGRLPTLEEMALMRGAIAEVHRAPEGVEINLMAATRDEYTKHLVLEVPGTGPAPEALKAEAEKRVVAAAVDRVLIGGEIPDGFLAGAAYGSGIIKVRDMQEATIAPNPYRVPVMVGLNIEVETRA